MRSDAVNAAIDRLVQDELLAARVRADGAAALDAFGLTPDAAHAIAEAVNQDARHPGEGRSFDALRKLAQIQPLFASYSATATKKG